MRLICPNCGAQYEVDAQVIPEAGRDVQCSGCGHTWFQQPANQDADLADELGLELPQDETHDTPEPHPEPAAAQADTPEHDHDEDQWQDEAEAPAPPPEGTGPRRELDEDVLGILREEAAREQDARQAESAALESQPDLGLDDGKSAKRGLRERMARLRGVDDAESGAAAAAAASGKRRDLLPDIEEINSTLRNADDDAVAAAEEPAPAPPSKSGFRLGFGLIVLIALVIVLLYVFAPKLAQMVPALEGPLTEYVALVNMVRNWFDIVMENSLDRVLNLLSSFTSSE